MTAPLLLPTSRLVSIGWLRLALPGVGVDDGLPEQGEDPAGYAAMRTAGFVRVPLVGGSPGRDVPRRSPVVTAECWFAPNARTQQTPWSWAEQLAERVVAATYADELMGRRIDLSAVGHYAPARVHTVVALSEPERVVTDKSDFARVDVDLQINWTGA